MQTNEFAAIRWVHIQTPHPDEAQQFFGQLFGWTFAAGRDRDSLIQVGGFGFGLLSGPPAGESPQIRVMVNVADVQAAAVKVAALEGKATVVTSLVDDGSMAVCTDPNGAGFLLFTTRETLAAPERPGIPGWFEVATPDPELTARFYWAMFGWNAELSPGSSRALMRHGRQWFASLRALPPTGQSRWTPWFTVQDLDATLRLAGELGAGIDTPYVVQGTGRVCSITSPQGVGFFIVQFAPWPLLPRLEDGPVKPARMARWRWKVAVYGIAVMVGIMVFGLLNDEKETGSWGPGAKMAMVVLLVLCGVFCVLLDLQKMRIDALEEEVERLVRPFGKDGGSQGDG